MIGDKKVIDVCITKAHDMVRTEYLSELSKCANASGYQLRIHNSPNDFYDDDEFSEGARNIYYSIDYDHVDVMVIFDEAFYDKMVVLDIINRSKEHNIPVIIIKGEYDGCYAVMGDCTDKYKELIRHLIVEHNIKNPFFIGGVAGDKVTSVRQGCVEEVLKEYDIPLPEDRIAYGGYYDYPVYGIMADVFENIKPLPDAFICANDSMALTVISELDKRGIKVPKDAIVSGFDGIPLGRIIHPSLTTCLEDYALIADKTFEVIEDIFTGNTTAYNAQYEYRNIFSESCGCKNELESTTNAAYITHYKIYDGERSHEDHMYKSMDTILQLKSLSDFFMMVSRMMHPNSFLFFDPHLIQYFANDGLVDPSYYDETHFLRLSSRYNSTEPLVWESVPIDAMGNSEDIKKADNIIFIPIHSMNNLCALYLCDENNISENMYVLNREAHFINLAFSKLLSLVNTESMQKNIAEAAFKNPTSGLYNLKGVDNWFEKYRNDPKNQDKAYSVSVYCLAKYSFIFDNYGINDVNDAIVYVSKTLIDTNSRNSFIGQISDDEFVVINYFEDYDRIGETIDRATTYFFKTLEDYNRDNGKEYYVEVNCGCTVVFPGQVSNISTLIMLARNEMYMYRLKSGDIKPVVKNMVMPRDSYNKYLALINGNLFRYAYQPIVDARTGDIYAYEALMRTDPSISMNPQEILQVALEYNRLYDIEKATMFNVFKQLKEREDHFFGKKIFINSIPGHSLNEDDAKSLLDNFAKYMSNCILEITEHSSVSDDELNLMASRRKEGMVLDIAIDDYGTGHSNIVNLLRYKPHIIKIDRFLIENVDKDENKQMFIRSTIEFAKANSIRVLAEGVETEDELRTVIHLGVDYIQGYFTGKPVFEPIEEIAPEIKKILLESNK